MPTLMVLPFQVNCAVLPQAWLWLGFPSIARQSVRVVFEVDLRLIGLLTDHHLLEQAGSDGSDPLVIPITPAASTDADRRVV